MPAACRGAPALDDMDLERHFARAFANERRTAMRPMAVAITLSTAVLLAGAAEAAGPPPRPTLTCPVDAVVSGSTCMDKYEASVWRVPNSTTTNRGLVVKIQQGSATVGNLTAGGATELGIAPVADYEPCANNGENCVD